MKKGFVPTANFRLMAEAQRQVERRGAAEAGIVIIRGAYGVGKSQIVERWAVDNGAIFVRCKEVWTKRALLDELAERMGLSQATTLNVMERSSGQSWIASDRMRRAIDGDYAPRAHMTLLEKDTRLAVEAAQRVGVKPALGIQASAIFAQASAAGFAKDDDAALLKHLSIP